MADLTTSAITVATGLLDLEGELVAAAAGGDTAEIGPNRFLVVANADASPHTATIATPGTVSGLAITDGSYAVAAGDTAIIPMANVFRGSTGRASITYDAVTDVTVGVFELGR